MVLLLRASANGARLLTLQRMAMHSAALNGSRASGRSFPQQTLLWRGFSSAYVAGFPLAIFCEELFSHVDY